MSPVLEDTAFCSDTLCLFGMHAFKLGDIVVKLGTKQEMCVVAVAPDFVRCGFVDRSKATVEIKEFKPSELDLVR